MTLHGLKPGYSAHLASAIDAHSAPNPLVCAPNRNPLVGFVLTAVQEILGDYGFRHARDGSTALLVVCVCDQGALLLLLLQQSLT
ncbi:hypothetical protein PF010_g672 [Phytophthora fragariae]|uniref:Uncharacterized protein n=1 Tax=Phytophthora fragariae TaxID=53985 RepID=A0A6A4AA47_9STRA|nr:hypothetical protein PF010_g672 [Phytophthora fragariae]KAE9240353.1 hypothetical protein PF004_g7556 [Phytophthora fragariae]KAE9255435.1 hypothetical protein PF002_g2338 [Phytophthora fragariae]